MKIFEYVPGRSNLILDDKISISKLTILLGPNGSGKSTVIQDIAWCLSNGIESGDGDLDDEPVLLIEPDQVDISVLRLVAADLVGMDDLVDVARSLWLDDDGNHQHWSPEFEDGDIDWDNEPTVDLLLFRETIA